MENQQEMFDPFSNPKPKSVSNNNNIIIIIIIICIILICFCMSISSGAAYILYQNSDNDSKSIDNCLFKCNGKCLKPGEICNATTSPATTSPATRSPTTTSPATKPVIHSEEPSEQELHSCSNPSNSLHSGDGSPCWKKSNSETCCGSKETCQDFISSGAQAGIMSTIDSVTSCIPISCSSNLNYQNTGAGSQCWKKTNGETCCGSLDTCQDFINAGAQVGNMSASGECVANTTNPVCTINNNATEGDCCKIYKHGGCCDVDVSNCPSGGILGKISRNNDMISCKVFPTTADLDAGNVSCEGDSDCFTSCTTTESNTQYICSNNSNSNNSSTPRTCTKKSR